MKAGNGTSDPTIMRNISESRQAEEHLHLHTAALQAAANAVVITDREGRIVWVNPAFTRLTGYTYEEALGQNPRLLKSGKHDQALYQDLWETILSGQVWHGQMINRRKDGSLYTEEMTITPVRDADAAISHFIGIKQDISERKRAEEALRASEERWQFALEGSGEGVWDWNVQTDEVTYSRRYKEMIGYAEHEICNRAEEWTSRIHPDDFAYVMAEHQKHFRGETKAMVVEYRFRCKDGSYKWILGRGKVVARAEGGEPLRMVGTHADITTRKQTEVALAERTRQLEAVRAVATEITQELNLPTLLGLITRRAAELVGVGSGAVHLWDEEAQMLVTKAWHGYGAWRGEVRLRLGEGVVGMVAQRRAGMIVNDYRASPYAHALFLERSSATAIVAEPLLCQDRLLGVIVITDQETGRSFTEEDQATLSLFATHAAIAIENARLVGQMLQRQAELRALVEAGRALTKSLNLNEILHAVVEQAAAISGTSIARLFLLDKDGCTLRRHVGVGVPPGVDQGLVVPVGQGFSGQVVVTGQPLTVPDVRGDSRMLFPHHVTEWGLISYLGLPVKKDGHTFGVLVFNAKAPRVYSEAEIAFLSAFATQATIAIENARLYEDRRLAAIQLEATVEDRTRELRVAMDQIQEASHHKSEFLANMSHELRTPLNSILGFSQLLLEQTQEVLPAKQTRFLTNIHNSGQHLLQLINDILDLSKVEAGKFVLQPEPLTVKQTLEDILVIGRGLANKKGQTIEPAIAPDLPPLHADPVRLKQILFNLLSNAVKFTPNAGRITVTAKAVPAIADCRLQIADLPPTQSEISNLKSEIESCWLELSVTDTGAGIRPEDLPKLFQEFTQLETTRAQKHEGTGLGLALTKRLVELHGGRIWAESEGEGKGSTFTVVLPFEQPETRRQ